MRRRRGLSLTEVLIATAVMVVVFVPLFRVFLSGVTTTRSTEDRLRAFSLAQQQIEVLKAAAAINRHSHEQITRAHLDGGGFAPFMVDDRYCVSTFVDADREVESHGRRARLCHVRVVVNWKIKGQERELELETMFDRSYR